MFGLRLILVIIILYKRHVVLFMRFTEVNPILWVVTNNVQLSHLNLYSFGILNKLFNNNNNNLLKFPQL